jgi:hypothetical protein
MGVDSLLPLTLNKGIEIFGAPVFLLRLIAPYLAMADALGGAGKKSVYLVISSKAWPYSACIQITDSHNHPRRNTIPFFMCS